MSILEDIWQVHGGLISVAIIVGVFATIGWASDEWEHRKEKRRFNIMRVNYLSRESVTVCLTAFVGALSGKAVAIIDCDGQSLTHLQVVPEQGETPKVCRVLVLTSLLGDVDSWTATGGTPLATKARGSYEYLTEEGLARLEPTQKSRPPGADFLLRIEGN